MTGFYEGCCLCSLRRRRLCCPEECWECSSPEIVMQGFIHSLGVYHSRVRAEHWTSRWSRAIIQAKQGYQPVVSSLGRILNWYISKYLFDLGPCLVTSVPGFTAYSGYENYTPGLIVQTGVKMVQQHCCRTDVQRRKNVSGIYSVSEPGKVRGRHVILLDDVVTSGATLAECGMILYKVGAAVVVSLTLGKTTRIKTLPPTDFQGR